MYEPKSLIHSNGSTVTMSSLEMVEYINSMREEGEPVLTHANFMAKVPKVLGEKGLIHLNDTYVHPQNNQTYPCYRFPKREACLMAMSYSYDLQAKVFDKMTELEAQTRGVITLPPTAQARQVIEDDLAVANLLGVPLYLAQSESVKRARLLTGVDYSHLLTHAPAQNDIKYEQVMLEPTERGKRYGLSGMKMNQALQRAGLQVRVGNGWEGTEAAKGQCAIHHWVDGSKSGQNLKWNVAFVGRTLTDLRKAA